MEGVPVWVLATVGTMVLANLGTIIAVFWGMAKLIAKGTWYVSKLESRVDKNEHDINGAHEKIRFNRSLLLKDGGPNGTTDS